MAQNFVLITLLGVVNMLVLTPVAYSNTINRRDEIPTTGSPQLSNQTDKDQILQSPTIPTPRQPQNKGLTINSLNELLIRSNENCLKAEDLASSVGSDEKLGFKGGNLTNASFLIVYFLQLNVSGETCNQTATIPEVSVVKAALFPSSTVCPEQLSALVSKIVANGRYVEDKELNECFSPSMLLSQCTSDPDVINEAMETLVVSVLRGFCILPDPSYFQKKLFTELDVDSTGHINEKEFEVLLHKLEKNDLDHHEEHEEEDHQEGVNESSSEQNVTTNTTSDGDQERTKRNAKTYKKRCYSSKDLLVIAGNKRNKEGNLILNQQGLIEICPALLQQFYSGSCESVHTETNTTENPEYTTSMKYGYGTLSVFLISLLAFVGLILFPSIGSSRYQLTMQFFIALGVGTLSGDAILHLIPEVLGLHQHEGEVEHKHEEEDEDKTNIYRLLVVIIGIYVFYLFENALRLYNEMKGKNLSLHHHHHNDTEHTHEGAGSQHVIVRTNTARRHQNEKDAGESNTENNNQSGKTSESKKLENYKIPPVAIMVFIGDALHNFGDGLALGVAFSSGWVTGVGTSLAIFCHELPHEFGDFAIYLKNGLTKWQAIGLNFIAACCSFIGLYIGLGLSENPEMKQWMLALIIGMFLYISLVDVLHEMVEEKSKEHPLLQFFLQNLGMCLGWAILFLLSLYEESIISSLNV